MEELRNAKGQTLAEFLAAYDVNKYPHPSVTSIRRCSPCKRWRGSYA